MGPDTFWTVAGALVPAFAGLAFGLVAMTPASFRAARVCFCLSALSLCGCASAWTWLSDFAYRFWIGVPVILISGAALILCLRWVDIREASGSISREEGGGRPSGGDTPDLRSISIDFLKRHEQAPVRPRLNPDRLQKIIDRLGDGFKEAAARRPRVHVVFDWKGSFHGCYEPFILKNDSTNTAQRISIGPIVRTDQKVARFPLVATLAGHDSAEVWPEIDNVPTREGHPDFAKFMYVALIGATRADDDSTSPAARTFASGVTLPFEITYSDLEGHTSRTRAQVKFGGEWGTGRIVVETLGFD